MHILFLGVMKGGLHGSVASWLACSLGISALCWPQFQTVILVAPLFTPLHESFACDAMLHISHLRGVIPVRNSFLHFQHFVQFCIRGAVSFIRPPVGTVFPVLLPIVSDSDWRSVISSVMCAMLVGIVLRAFSSGRNSSSLSSSFSCSTVLSSDEGFSASCGWMLCWPQFQVVSLCDLRFTPLHDVFPWEGILQISQRRGFIPIARFLLHFQHFSSLLGSLGWFPQFQYPSRPSFGLLRFLFIPLHFSTLQHTRLHWALLQVIGVGFFVVVRTGFSHAEQIGNIVFGSTSWVAAPWPPQFHIKNRVPLGIPLQCVCLWHLSSHCWHLSGSAFLANFRGHLAQVKVMFSSLRWLLHFHTRSELYAGMPLQDLWHRVLQSEHWTGSAFAAMDSLHTEHVLFSRKADGAVAGLWSLHHHFWILFPRLMKLHSVFLWHTALHAGDWQVKLFGLLTVFPHSEHLRAFFEYGPGFLSISPDLYRSLRKQTFLLKNTLRITSMGESQGTRVSPIPSLNMKHLLFAH